MSAGRSPGKAGSGVACRRAVTKAFAIALVSGLSSIVLPWSLCGGVIVRNEVRNHGRNAGMWYIGNRCQFQSRSARVSTLRVIGTVLIGLGVALAAATPQAGVAAPADFPEHPAGPPRTPGGRGGRSCASPRWRRRPGSLLEALDAARPAHHRVRGRRRDRPGQRR